MMKSIWRKNWPKYCIRQSHMCGKTVYNVFTKTGCSNCLTSVRFYKFISSNHLILFSSNKRTSGAIRVQRNCNKVYMLTVLVPALLKRVDSSTNSLNVSRAAFEIFSYSFWEGYRLTGLIICDKTLLYSPLQKKRKNMKVKLSSVKL